MTILTTEKLTNRARTFASIKFAFAGFFLLVKGFICELDKPFYNASFSNLVDSVLRWVEFLKLKFEYLRENEVIGNTVQFVKEKLVKKIRDTFYSSE